MKRCCICKIKKEASSFSPKENRCKPCNVIRALKYRDKNPDKHRKASLTYYNKNKEIVKGKMRERAKNKRIRNNTKIWEYLLQHPCVDCGETDPIVLQFDHIKENKNFAIASAGNFVWDKIEKEIKKCEVRCANCHARKTHKERGYFNLHKEEEM